MNLLLLTILSLFSFSNCKENVPDEQQAVAIHSEIILNRVPFFAGKTNSQLLSLEIKAPAGMQDYSINRIDIQFENGSNLSAIDAIRANFAGQTLMGKIAQSDVSVDGSMKLKPGQNIVNFTFSSKSDADLLASFSVKEIILTDNKGGKTAVTAPGRFIYRPAQVLRAAGQDNCHTYRIPGLITTNQGTLIAVYDNRYNNSKDLQEDIDIGMSRSTDGGQSWEPMKVIMDMGEWGGRPERLNGAGDPCVLYDPITGTIWVAALWMTGSAPDQMLWWASKPGMKPDETGQFILVKSTDDGASWSAPVNITEQIKNPAWQLLLQGPGRGISMKNGTLVFPAQFKADMGEKALDGGQFTCHSTIVYSTDHGQSWKIGTGAKSNTTEAQVVELSDGRLMLNMRDDRNRKDKSDTNGRAVATSADMGKTWSVHPSSNSALPESNCMASIISADVSVKGKKQQVLFFSNPNNKNERKNMTIKASLDGGLTWPEELQVELNAESGYGYSCMSMVDEKTIGILYEGVSELFFQKVKVEEILKEK